MNNSSNQHLSSDSPDRPVVRDNQAVAGSQLAPRSVAVAVVICLVLFSGVVHGVFDGRWTTNQELVAVGNKLDQLPDQFGDWKLQEVSQLDPAAAQLLRCYGSTVRVYRNETLDATVNVAILFGPRGPIAVHTPEICYSSVGTSLVGERQVRKIGGVNASDTFWSVQFAVDPLPDPSLEVWYGWSDGEGWEAREQPRFWLTDRLYKIQVAGPVGAGGTSPVSDFVNSLLPHTQRVMTEK